MIKDIFIKNLQVLQEKFIKKHNTIQQDILKHLGKYAILIEKRGRNSVSFLIQITGDHTGKYKCYDFEGNFRCCISKYLDVNAMIIGEQELIYLDDI